MAARPVAEDDLQAYVDGHLDSQRLAMVEAYLAIHPDEAERIEAYRAQRIGMHVLFDSVADEPIPAHLVALERRLSRALTRRRWLRASSRIAASLAALAIAATAGWWASQRQLLNDDPILAFARSVSEGGALAAATTAPGQALPDDESRLIGWLTQNAAAPAMPMPNLQPFGYKLLGGRVVPTPAGPAVQLTYEDGQAQRVNLYISSIRGARKTDFTFVHDGGASLFYWSDGSLVYALIGKLDHDDLLRMAKAVSGAAAPAPGEAARNGASPGIYRTDADSAKPANPPGAKVMDPPPATSAPAVPPSGLAPPAAKPDGGPATPKKPDETRT